MTHIDNVLSHGRIAEAFASPRRRLRVRNTLEGIRHVASTWIRGVIMQKFGIALQGISRGREGTQDAERLKRFLTGLYQAIEGSGRRILLLTREVESCKL